MVECERCHRSHTYEADLICLWCKIEGLEDVALERALFPEYQEGTHADG